MIRKLPQGLRLRLLLALIAVYKGAHPTPAGGTYSQWLWSLLDGPLGLILTQLPQESKAINDAQARQFPDHLQKFLWTHMGTLLSPFFRICGCCAVCSRVLQADTDHAANEAHMLCMTEAFAAREDVLALWAWLRSHLALGLMERWAADKGAQVCQSCVDHQSCMDGKCAHSLKNSEPVCLFALLDEDQTFKWMGYNNRQS